MFYLQVHSLTFLKLSLLTSILKAIKYVYLREDREKYVYLKEARENR